VRRAGCTVGMGSWGGGRNPANPSEAHAKPMRRLCEAPANNTLLLPDPHAIPTLLTRSGVALGGFVRGSSPPSWQSSPGSSPSRITHHASPFPFPYWPPPTLSCKTVAKQMALESKPLFHPEVLRQQVRAFTLPERAVDWQPKLQHWAGLITSDRADGFKETALLSIVGRKSGDVLRYGADVPGREAFGVRPACWRCR